MNEQTACFHRLTFSQSFQLKFFSFVCVLMSYTSFICLTKRCEDDETLQYVPFDQKWLNKTNVSTS